MARPDRAAEPDLFKFWSEMFEEDTVFMVPEFPDGVTISDRRFRFRRVDPERRTLALLAHRRGEDSSNWSGAYVKPMPSHRFSFVSGSWTVPKPNEPMFVPADTDRHNCSYRSSTWIGLGGHRPYYSLPQIGTAQRVVVENGTPRQDFGVWWQWWVRDLPQYHVPMPITNFLDVQGGDEIIACMAVECPNDVHFSIKNRRTKRFVTFKVCAPPDVLPLGSTAEWIHERPTKFGGNETFPLPDCKRVVFRHCLTRSSMSPGTDETTQRLERPHLVRMYELFDDPHRAAFVSVPKPLPEENGLQISYRETTP